MPVSSLRQGEETAHPDDRQMLWQNFDQLMGAKVLLRTGILPRGEKLHIDSECKQCAQTLKELGGMSWEGRSQMESREAAATE